MNNGHEPDLAKFDNLILPDYGGNCIVNIPKHIKFLHNATNTSVLYDQNCIAPANIKKTVLFVLDGFGYKQWLNHQDKSPVLARFASNGCVKPLTAMFPASTAVSLAAFSTGLTTQQHGLLEWWITLLPISSQ